MFVRHGTRHTVNRLMRALETRGKEVRAGHFHVHGDPTSRSAWTRWIVAQISEGHLGYPTFATLRIQARNGLHAEVEGLVWIVRILNALSPFESTVQENQHNKSAREGNTASG